MIRVAGGFAFIWIGVLLAVYIGMIGRDQMGQQILAAILLAFVYSGLTDRE